MAQAVLAWLLNAAGLEAPADGLSLEELAQGAVQLAIQHHDRSTEAFALQTLGEVLRRKRPDDAVALLERAIEVAVRSEGQPVRYAQAAPAAVAGGSAAALAAMWLHRDLAAAQRWEEEAVRWGERIGYSANLALGWQMLGTIALARGEHANAERLLSAADAALRGEDLPIYRVWPLLGLARLAYERFQLADAGERFRDLGALSRDLGHREIQTRAGLGLVDTLLAAGDLDEATDALDVLDPQLNHPEHQAGVLIRRARLARLTGVDDKWPHLLATAAQLLPPEGVPPDRVLWFVESAFAALRGGGGPGQAAATLVELDRRVAEVGLTISPPERRYRDQLPELPA